MNQIFRICIFNRNIYKSFEISKRFAGHSKWQNVKHIKSENDSTRAILFLRLRKMIREAALEGGSTKPTLNTKLARVIEYCKKLNMPAASINNLLDKLANSKERTKATLIEINGPKNCIMILKIVSDNMADTKSRLNTILKKINAKVSIGAINSSFEHNGIIITNKKFELEKAMEDAINVGASDIEEIEDDDKKYYKFICEPQLLSKITTKLKSLDYQIIDVRDELIPLFVIKLSDDDLKIVKLAQERLLYLDEIEEIYDNIDHDNL
ncbi:translational activator of cytochrome c oxidase 1 [Vespa velutina]|uniref:translational activator of cytochrome c oxidase 1 n=1 Tax=Vespa velutina TaxID=202808 RepID=UPI001FB499CE|nr:translational activator of cytochrome c oxidase 1 [Vespa velutina]